MQGSVSRELSPTLCSQAAAQNCTQHYSHLLRPLTQEALGDHLLQQLYTAASKPLPKGLAEVFSDVLRHIHTNFICEGGGTHGKAEACGQGVQLLRVNPFLDGKESRSLRAQSSPPPTEGLPVTTHRHGLVQSPLLFLDITRPGPEPALHPRKV